MSERTPTVTNPRLRAEMLRRMNDGWDLYGDQPGAGLTMRHVVLPPFWRLAVDLLNPLTWLFGPSWTAAYRTLTVSIDGDGRLDRRTTGVLPRGWPREYDWEVPDGSAESP